jgi:formylglycine-generating enzyme required for sulfatase activity
MAIHLVLQFLGSPQLFLNDQPIATDRRKAIALLAYLAINDLGRPPQRYSREALSALLWPDYEQAKAYSNLRRTIWEIRQVIGENWLSADRETVYLNAGVEIDLDVARFQDLLFKSSQQKNADLRIPILVDAIKLYRDHFLTGFSLKDAHPFNDWAFTESEELRYKFAKALTLLVESYFTLKQAEQAIPYARRLITLDPLNESSHRQLMQVYIQTGQHNAALKQYQTFEKILRKELGVDPQPETRALYKQIRKGEFKSIQPVNQKVMESPQHNLPLQISTFIEHESEQNKITLATEGVTREKSERKQHSQLIRSEIWARLKKPTLLLNIVIVCILLSRLISAAIPAGTLMPFPQKDGMKLHYVPAGSFMMGSDERGPGGEMPVHKVILDAFWIDETEITNGMYMQCVEAGACQPPGNKWSSMHDSYYDDLQYTNYPVVYVSWNDAQAYCHWAGRALPSEAQWEKAARGIDGRSYPWGNQVPDKDLLNYNNNIGDTTEVGKYPNGKSPYGAYDMAGNVWEWVSDWYGYDYYANSPPYNPFGPDSGQNHVVRGGAWAGNDCGYSAADRCAISPGVKNADLGFRCALSFP